MLVNIETALHAGKKAGYEHWVKVFNINHLSQEVEFIQYCAREERTLKELEANLRITDDPEEIAIGTLKNACD